MNRRTWKKRETAIAKRLHGRRIPVTGIDRDGADVETELFAIQVKHGRNRPSYLQDWLGGICQTAALKGKTGVVVWSAMREAQGEAVVVLRLQDFEGLLGRIRPETERER